MHLAQSCEGTYMDAAIWGLIGTIVGALASIGTTWLSARGAHVLQREKSREARAERASEFQRQTLLDLQDAIHEALRLVHQAYFEDLAAHHQTKEWGMNMLSDEVNEGVRLALRRVSILVERVADDELRSMVKKLMSGVTQVLLSHNQQESRLYIEKMSVDTGQVLERVGAALRHHY